MNSAAVRTQGDGIENPDVTTPEVPSKNAVKSTSVVDDNIDKLGKEFLSKQFQSTSSIVRINPLNSESQNYNYPPPTQPKGKRFYLIPKLIKSSTAKINSLKNKKLNLVLMEPYRVS